MFACCSSKPKISPTGTEKAVKPPETKAVYAPFAFIVLTKVFPPGRKVILCSNTSSTTVLGHSANKATRSFKASWNPNSPFMARIVIFFTSLPTPYISASSSIHSCSIIVLSMSAKSNDLK